MTIVYFIVVLGIIILIHEIGHFTAAKAFKVYCQEFALGFGPTLLKYQGKETKYSLRILPFGGYVSMAGDQGVEIENLPFERTLKGVNRLKRAIIMLSGIAMNVLLTWALLSAMFIADPRQLVSPPPIIDGIVETYPAAVAGVKVGDEVVAVTFHGQKRKEIRDYFELATLLAGNKETLVLEIKRADQLINIEVTPIYNEENGRYLIGINGRQPELRHLSFLQCFSEAGKELVFYSGEMFKVIGNLLQGQGLENLSGPLGIAQMTGEQAQAGFINLVFLVAILSLNVALFNLLPLPILDGGRVILILIEALLNKPLNKKFETALMLLSLLVIGALMFIAFYNDIIRMF